MDEKALNPYTNNKCVHESTIDYHLKVAISKENKLKETAIGFIPIDWKCALISSVAKLESGHTPSKKRPEYWNGNIQWISLHDTNKLSKNLIYFTTKTITTEGLNNSSARLLPSGTVVFSRTATVGKVSIMGQPMATSQDFANYICGPELYNLFLVYLFRSMGSVWHSYMAGSIHNTIYMPTFQSLQIAIPPIHEQRNIANALSDVDALLAKLDQLIAKKRDIKKGAMQNYLTGRMRLPSFNEDWVPFKIKEIAFSCSEQNKDRLDLPVLSCSKHFGFVDSLSYFKNQVFSQNTAGYKIIARGQIGYPSNHIEEGSIGLQDLYDFALVSPIYIVFSTRDNVNSYFLHRLLKLEEYRQKFETATGASVDRRGSLRWPEFSEISVLLPSSKEQMAISEMLRDIEKEIYNLEQQRNKTHQLKQGMMQQLLTGKIRLV